MHCADFDRVLDNLYLGGIFGSFQPELLKQQGITHILTLLDQPLHADKVSDFTYKFVYTLDMEVHNLLQNLQECLDFVEQGRKEGTVLVHCAAGVSRSATVVIAYIMKTNQLSLDEAVKFVQERRPCVSPNDGFMEQLQLFEKMGCRVDCSNEEFRRYTLSSLAFGFGSGLQQVSDMPSNLYISEETSANTAKETVYRCRKCRRPLFRGSALMEHRKGAGEAAFDWRGKGPAGRRDQTDAGDNVGQDECFESLFIEPIEWMKGHIEEPAGKLACPKCQSKLGSFVWYGEQCPCGAWVAPAFHIQRSKVDEIKPGFAPQQSLPPSTASAQVTN